jgi:dTDP-4-dehydrorhamnose reductase
MKIWIIGASGMVGSTLLKLCEARGIHVVGTGHKSVDICDLKEVKRQAQHIQPTHIVNCAAYTNVDKAESEQSQAFLVNATGAEHGALAAKEVGARFVHISTDYVFGSSQQKPFKEEDPCAPINVYGKSKLEGEKRVLHVMPEALVVRTSWVFGLQGKNLVSSLLQRFFKEKTLQVVSDQQGKPTYCEDLCEALLFLLPFSGIVHFANEGGASRYAIACDLLSCARQRGLAVLCEKIEPVLSSQFVTPAARPSYSVLDTTLYTKMTGQQPRHWLKAAEEFLHHV